MTPTDINSGVYKYIFNQYDYFDKDIFKFGFLTRNADALMKTAEYKKYGFSVHPFSSVQRDNPQALKREIIDTLLEYDIIHLHTSSWRGFLIEEIAMEVGMNKVIVHSHSTGIDVKNDFEREVQYKEHEKYKKAFSEKYATDFCACSKKAAKWLFGDSISLEKVKILPNSIDTNKYAYSVETRNNIRCEYGLDDCFVIGNVGRFSYTKNQAFLLSLMPDILKIIPNAKLILIGEGQNKQLLEKALEDQNLQENVIILDWVNNIQDYLCAMDIFCLPSLFEGFPISVIEAQTSGLPCIMSDRITEEAEITCLATRLPLLKERWIDMLVNLYETKGDVERDKAFVQVQKSGFDVRDCAQKLVDLWKI